jgi:hypothetical protein
MNRISSSYLFWLCWFIGFAGLHRIYNGKIFTGLLWFFTWGLFGVGQIIDLLLIPSMVEEHNLKVQRRLGLSSQNVPLNSLNPQVTQTFLPSHKQPLFNKTKSLSQQEMMIELARAAQKRGGKLSITQAVIDTGISFEEVENTLNEMTKKGYIIMDNDPDTGAIVYNFVELL